MDYNNYKGSWPMSELVSGAGPISGAETIALFICIDCIVSGGDIPSQTGTDMQDKGKGKGVVPPSQ